MTDTRRPRILLVTRNLPPLVGGMERLNWHMAETLSKMAEVRVIGPQGAAAKAPAGVVVREAPLKPLWHFLWQARQQARSEARTFRPDIVLAGSGLTTPIARSAAHVCGAKTCVYVHGLDVAVRHPAYRLLWLPAIRGMDRVIANSRATADLCCEIGVPPERLGIVHPGVDLPDLEALTGAAERFRARHDLGRRPLLVSVGRLSARKGLREFVTRALPRIVAQHPEVLLLVVGDEPNQALHAQAQTPESIYAAAHVAGVAAHIRLLGRVSEGTLAEAYCAAQVHVFPVREIPGDPEGFGMVAVEAAAHGVPTVAFATGGVVDAVADGVSGKLVTQGDYGSFAEAVLKLLRHPAAWPVSGCHRFAQRFAWSEFGKHLWQRLDTLVVSCTGHGKPAGSPENGF